MDQFGYEGEKVVGGYAKLLELAQANKTKAALREAINGAGIQIIETEPLSGYYRCAAVKNGPLLPVAIWRDEGGKLVILRSNQPVALERVWPYCVWTPIPYDWYEAATERGEKWPDEPATAVATPEPANDAAPEPSREQIGGNNPPVEDEATALKNQIDAAKGVAEQDYQEIKTDDEAAAAQALRSRLLELSGSADKKREAEKRPHFDAAKAVDTKWQPVVKAGKAAADWLRDRLSVYATKKANAEAEERRKALAEEARIAEQKRKDDEAKWASGEQPGPEITEPAATPTPPPANANTTTIKGASGRAASVRVVKKAIVTDYDKAFAHLKAIPEIKSAIDKVAQRFIDAGNEVPGVEVHEERRVA